MSGDFQATVQAHKDRLYALAVHLTGDRSEAEDVVQESFMKLWQHRATLDGDATLPWLLSVARNASLDRLRRRRMVPVDGTQLEARESVEPQPDRRLSDEEFTRRLNRAVAELNEPYRSLVVMREMQGLDYQTIAEALALSLSQVKVYLHRTRRRLRHQLSEFAHD